MERPGVHDSGARWQDAAARAARAWELRAFSREHLRLARQRRLVATQARRRTASRRNDRARAALAMAQGPPLALPPPEVAVDDLLAHVEAIWLTLASCRTQSDGESGAEITVVMRELDNVARSAYALAPAERSRLRNDLREIDEMASAFRAHLHRPAEQQGGP